MTMKHFKEPLGNALPSMNVTDVAAWLGDVAVSSDKEKAITCGFFRLEHSEPLVYTYTYDEMKFVVDGEFTISDESGVKVDAVKGDVFYFSKGSVITFETKSFGIGFFCGQRRQGEA